MGSDKSTLRSIAEISSAAVVVISLVFVGFEVRESARQTELNTRAIQVSSYQDLISQITEVGSTIAFAIESTPGKNLYDAAAAGPNRIGLDDLALELEATWAEDDLPSEEYRRLIDLYIILTRHSDLAFYQYELGMLSEERLNSALAQFAGVICSPRYHVFWTRLRGAFWGFPFREPL